MESIEDLYIQALDASLIKDYPASIALFKQVIAKDPKYMDAYHSLAMTFLHSGKVDEAIKIEEEALKINPNELMAHSNLSVFLMKKGLIKEAEAAKAKATILTWKQENKDRKQQNPSS